jgi:hypothetical protein
MIFAIIITQLFFIYFNLWAGNYQAHRFDVEQKPISHFAWAFVYGLLCVITSILIYKGIDLCFIAALAVLRLPVFNSSLNYHRKPRRPIFYTNPVWSRKTEQSFLNKLWGNWYPLVFFICIAIYITLQFFIYDQSKETSEPPAKKLDGITNVVAK